jgi:hypothetical protein
MPLRGRRKRGEPSRHSEKKRSPHFFYDHHIQSKPLDGPPTVGIRTGFAARFFARPATVPTLLIRLLDA